MEEGYVAIQHGEPNHAIDVLATDPWCADLTYNIAAYYFLQKDQANMSKWAARFVQIAPRSRFIQRQP
jgi:hypothetical protein